MTIMPRAELNQLSTQRLKALHKSVRKTVLMRTNMGRWAYPDWVQYRNEIRHLLDKREHIAR